jgi:hypothetical protein
MSVVLLGSTSGSVTLQEPAVAGTNTVNFGANTGVAILDANTPAFRNRLINSDMRIDQRNAGATSTAQTYTVDRWNYDATQSTKFTWGQNYGGVSLPAGFINYLGFKTTTAYTVISTDTFYLRQLIEGLNVADLAWGTANASAVTLSFQVYSSLTGTFGGALQNSASNRSYPFSFTVSTANTWTSISITIAGDTSGTWLTTNGIGIKVIFSLGAGSNYLGTANAWAGANYNGVTGQNQIVGTLNNTFYITGVQLEKGSTATSFDYRSYGTELNLCQRYAYVNRVVSGSFNAFCISGFFESTTATVLPVKHPVEMRSSPTFSFTAANTFFCQTTSNVTPSAISLGNANTFGAVLSATVSGVTAGTGCHLIRNNNNGSETTITASAEL